jgi:HEAT repeat protein
MVDPDRSASPSRDNALAERRIGIILAGHRGDLDLAAEGLSDSDPSIRAAALGAVARAGGWTQDFARKAMSDADVLVRTRTYELISSAEGLKELLCAGLSDEDPLAVVACCAALGRLGIKEAVAQLAGLAGEHPDLRCQEAAVAALGEIGDPAGLAAVLEATKAKPAVRRRAAVALAGFEGKVVEDALDQLAEDRDWQVRDVVTRLRRDPIT